MCPIPACWRTWTRLIGLWLCSGWAASAALAGDTITVGREGQVFVDDYAIESMAGLARRLHPLAKHPANPVLKPDRKWEVDFALPNSLFYDDELQLYRMWYRPGRNKFGLAYATSRDGLSWDKPALGLEEFDGARNTNRLILDTGPAWGGVIKDLRESNPQHRYKLLSYNVATKSAGLFLNVSPDGLTWQQYSDKPLLEGLADVHTLMGWDEKIQRYVAYVRPDLPVRTIARTTSEDLIHWSEIESVLAPDEVDPPGTQFYGMSVFPDRGVYYGLLWVYHPNQLTIDVQLTFSRDGVHWQRAVHRHPILMFGLPDEWDSSMLIAMQPILKDNEYKVFYTGNNRPHAVVFPNEVYPPLTKNLPREQQSWLVGRVGCGGLATCRRDRFVSLEAGDKEGTLVTKPLQLDGEELRLNADAKGRIVVEILDENGQPIPGFTAADVIPMRNDDVAIPVRWKSGKKLTALQGRTVQLRITLWKTKLYALEVSS